MTTKRSAANAAADADQGAPQSKQSRTDPTASSNNDTDDQLAPVSDDALPDPDPDDDAKTETRTRSRPRARGVTIDQLDNIRAMYDKGTTLRGWSRDDQSQVLYPYDRDLNEKIYVWQGDITTLEVDCIVNAANKSLLGGGGVDGAIHRAAGPGLVEECATLNGCETGHAKLTHGHGLAAKFVAHTVGPVYSRNKSEQSRKLLGQCYRSTLDLCVAPRRGANDDDSSGEIKSVAFSGISTGIYGFPIDDAARVACQEVREFLESDKGQKIDHVIFCNFREVDVTSYVDNLPSYFPPPPPSPRDDKVPFASEEATSSSSPVEEGDKVQQGEGDAESTDGQGDGASVPNGRERDDDKPESTTTRDDTEQGATAPPTSSSSGKVPEGRASARKTGKQLHRAAGAE